MGSLIKKIFVKLIHTFPIIILYILVLTGFDLSFTLYERSFSFNFVSIVIFYWVLKKPDLLGYGLVFFSGLINDVVQDFPIGISSINYLSLCAIAAFISARTFLPNLLYDWLLFFVAILIVSSIDYSVLTLIFDFPIKYETLMLNSFITFLMYPILAKIFDEINILDSKQENAQ